tara:strand:- start:428 stop:2458 length:2031 start_codon:yes stop_codon:yes gene_type:complete
MAQFNYTGAQGSVQIGATQYNVQPNLAASNAIKGLEKSILGAMQVGGQIKQQVQQEGYQTAALEQSKRHEAFQTEIAGMDYPERKAAVTSFNQQNASLYDETSRFGKQLSANEIAFQGGVTQRLQTEGVEYEYLDNQTSQNLAFLDAKKQWVGATPDQKTQILADLKASQIDPLNGFNDKYSKKLLNSAQTSLTEFEIAVKKEAIAATDQNLWGSALENVATQVSTSGTITKEQYEAVVAQKLGKLSTYSEKGTALRQKLDESILYSIVAKAKEEMGNNPTYAGAQLLNQRLQDFAAISPKVKGSDTYSSVLNTANAFLNKVNTADLGSLNSLLVDDGASLAQFSNLATNLQTRGVLSQEDYNAGLFRKKAMLVEKNVKPQIVTAYQNKDMAALGNLVSSGRGGTVTTIITANLEQELAFLVNSDGVEPSEAIGQIMQKAATFEAEGILIGKIDAVDKILNMPKNGGIQSPEDVKLFVNTMRQARKNNYNSPVRKDVQADYFVLESWSRIGVQDIAEKFQTYKINPSKVTDKEVLAAYTDAVGNSEFFESDLTPANDRRFKAALLPGIKALIKAGVDPETAGDLFEDAVDANFIKLNNGVFKSGAVLMPKVGALNSESAFKTVNKFFKGGNVVPMNVFQPEGDWMILDEKTGAVEIYPFAAIESVAKFGKLPAASQ